MSKLVRILSFVTGGVLLLLIAGVGAVSLPSVQTWWVHRHLARHPEYHLTVGRVACGWNRVHFERVVYRRAGLVLTLPEVTSELSFAAARRGQVEIGKLEAKGWKLELVSADEDQYSVIGGSDTLPTPEELLRYSAAQDAAKARAENGRAIVFDGVLKPIRLPIDMAIASADLDGEVNYPISGGKQLGNAHLHLLGSALRSGQVGHLTAYFETLAADAAASAVSAKGELEVLMDSPRTLSRLAVELDASAKSPRLTQTARLSITGSATKTGKGEAFLLEVKTADDAPTPKQLLGVWADFPYTSARLTGNWKLNGSDRDVAPFTLGFRVPPFEASGEGEFQLDRTMTELHASGRFDATIQELGLVKPELRPIRTMRARSDFDLLQHGDDVRVNRLSLLLAGDHPVATVDVLQPIEFDFATGDIKVAEPQADLVRVGLQGLPLSWVQPFFHTVTLSQGEIRGEFLAAARDDGIIVKTLAPFSAGAVSIARGDTPVVTDLDISVTANGSYANHAWQMEISELTLNGKGGQPLLRGSGKVGRFSGSPATFKAMGHYEAALSTVLSQPVARRWASVSAGIARGDFSVSANSVRQAAVKVELTGLRSLASRPLPDIAASVRADWRPDGELDLDAPLTVTNGGRRSDLRLSGTLRADGPGQAIDLQLTGKQAQLGDIQEVIAILEQLPAAARVAKSKEESAVAVQTAVSPWNGLGGQVSVRIDRTRLVNELELADLSAVMRFAPESVTLEKVAATAGAGSQLKGSAALHFDPAAPLHYRLAGNVSIEGLDTATAFKSAETGRPPTVEGTFDLDGSFNSRAASSAELWDRLVTNLRISSKSGVFRGFSKADWPSKIQRTSSKLDMMWGILRPGEKLSEHVANIDQIAQRLAEIHFDQMSLLVTADQSEHIAMKDFSLIAPEIRLTGQGTVTRETGVEWLNQAFTARLELGARGRLGELMRKEGLTRTTSDKLGYNPLYAPIVVDGTLSNVDTDKMGQVMLQKLLAYESATIFDNVLPTVNKWRFW